MPSRFRSPAILALVLAALLLMAQPLAGAVTVVINEFQASNGETIADEDGDFEDWIELYNHGSEPVLLGGYGLSDDEERPFRWVLPDVSLGPGEFLLVFASNKDRTDGPFLHTNYAISSSGKELLLTAPDGALIDFVPPTPVPRDISFGRKPDGIGEWFFFDDPTPGTENTTEAFLGILDPPEFSHEGGFYEEAFGLTLEALPGTQIRYTLDGSKPDEYSLNYVAPIQVTTRAGDPNVISEIPTNDFSWAPRVGWVPPGDEVQKATVVRAASMAAGYLASPPVSATYFVDDLGADRYSFPVISLQTDPENLFGYEEGIYVPGKTWDEAGNADSPHWSDPANYNQRGREWERPVHFEYFSADGKLELSHGAGVRIHGGWSRILPQKTFRLYTRGSYGEDWFNHAFFKDRPYDTFKRILLRNAGNDYLFLHFRDALMQTLVEDMTVSTQAFQPSVVFVNGEYWGVFHMRERQDRFYLATRYGVDPDNIDLLARNRTVREGDASHYVSMLDFIVSSDMNEAAAYNYIATQMDIDNFIAYQTAQIYFRNTDWPGKNIDFWRLRIDYEPDAPTGLDGRWRWLLFDTDFGFGFNSEPDAYKYDMLSHATDPILEPGTSLLKNLLENDEFRNAFITKMADSLNSRFQSGRVLAHIDAMEVLIAPEIEEHLQRWRAGVFSKSDWVQALTTVRTFATHRPAAVREHYVNFFDLEGTYELSIAMPPEGAARVRVNSVELEANGEEWTGIYFLGVPIEVEILPEFGHEFIGWEGAFEGEGTLLELNPGSDLALQPVLKEDAVFLHEVVLPRFMQGESPNNNDRVPFSARLRIEGLLPNALYRYANRVVTLDDPPTQNGAGNAIYFDFETGAHFRTTDTPDFAEPGTYGEFTTDDNGVYEGWFTLEPSGNARFGEPELFIRVLLNDGMGGEEYRHFLTTENIVQVLPFGFAWDEATGIYATSPLTPGDVAVLHDDIDGAGRPLTATLIEAAGFEVDDRYAAFYGQFVSGFDGHFGALLPNLLPDGLRRIESFDWFDAESTALYTSADGFWPDNADTVNPDGGLGFPIGLVLGAPDSEVPGDVNGDGVVNAVDVQLVINAALGIAIDPAYNPDINNDGVVNAVDVQLVINAALGVAAN